MKAKGLSCQVGDIVPYVICANDQTSVALKAFHPDEVRKSSPPLIIDYDWYLAQQIHPPISRLCQYIEGTDSGRIADCLGLDSTKFAKHDDAQYSLQISEEEKFASVTKWAPSCPLCAEKAIFETVRKQVRVLFTEGK